MKIAVFGLGYVGSTLSVMLAKHHDVHAVDLDSERAKAIKERRSPIGDELMDRILQTETLHLSATQAAAEALEGADFVVIATNTELDEETGKLRTSSVESVLRAVYDTFTGEQVDKRPVIVIKSTVPTGYTKALREEHPEFTFLFCPEFLREKTAMEDVLRPSRVIIGFDEDPEHAEEDEEDPASTAAHIFSDILTECSDKDEIPVLYTGTEEAEAIKLFSNSYLATRIAFFNELDTFAQERGLSTETIIHGVCLDPRIGDWYNEPGPGYGGACLPKDTRQLLSDFGDLPESIIKGVIESNEARKAFVHDPDTEKDK